MTKEIFSHKLEKLLQTSPLAWWQWNIITNEVTFNKLKLTMLGYDVNDFTPDQFSYQTFMDLVHPDDYDRTMEAMRAHLQGRAMLYQIDYRIKAKDGAYKWYLDRGSIIKRTPDGKPHILRGIVFNLGELTNVESKEEASLKAIRSGLPIESEGKSIWTICSNCKSIKTEDKSWFAVDESLYNLFDADISHGICPKCISLLYPDLVQKLLTRKRFANQG